MIIGTSYFESFQAAVNYYSAYGFNRVDVGSKRANGEIHIGRPFHKSSERVLLNTSEGRYFIEVQP